jgi:parallel beta-helix repeat protein
MRVSARVFRVLVLLLSSAGTSTAPLAAMIHIEPGPGTPVQDAIDAASPGDTVALAAGNYPEHIVIDKSLKLRGRGYFFVDISKAAILDGECSPGPVITVAADGVKIVDLLIAQDAEGAVHMTGRDRVTLRKVFAASNCISPNAATYDIQQSTGVRLIKVWAAGYTGGSPSGIRIGSTLPGGRVLVRSSVVVRADVGVLVQNSGPASVFLVGNDVNFNGTGIRLESSDGNVVSQNDLVNNIDAGIVLDASSDGNRVIGNTVAGSTTDVSDAGTGNCWKNNQFTTGSVPGCP